MKTSPMPPTAGATARVLAARHTLSAPRLLLAAVPLLLALLLLATLAGCGGGLLGGGGGVGDRPSRAEIRGEVERVETSANEIDLWTEDRRLVTVDYDADTPVYYQGERYEPRSLEAGDVIVVDAVQSGSGWLAQRIDVERGRQDRAGADDPPYGDEPYEDDEVATLTGEVRKVDTGNREIELATNQGVHSFHYRSGTVVYFQGERYEVTNLEPGDVVRARVERDYRGDWVTDAITVERSRQQRAGEVDDPNDPYDDRYDDRNADVLRYAGTVEEVDIRRGEFVLRTERYGTQTVVMPYDASTSDRREFEDLRRGDYVRFEGEPAQSGRVELLRFGWSAT